MKPTLEQVCAHFATVHEQAKRATWLSSLGFRSFSAGAYKTAWKHPRWEFVVKLAHNPYNEAGVKEIENYDLAPDRIKPFLVPIVAWGDGFQIQEHVAKVHDCDMYPDCPVFHFDDMCGKNHVHIANGEPRVYDYGQENQWQNSHEESEHEDS